MSTGNGRSHAKPQGSSSHRHSDPVSAQGHSKITSPVLPLHFNVNPLDIIKLLELRSSETGTSLGPLPELFKVVLDNPNVDLPVRCCRVLPFIADRWPDRGHSRS